MEPNDLLDDMDPVEVKRALREALVFLTPLGHPVELHLTGEWMRRRDAFLASLGVENTWSQAGKWNQ